MKKNGRNNVLAIIIFIIGLVIYLVGLFLLFGSTLGKVAIIKKLFSFVPMIVNGSLSSIKLIGGILFAIGFIVFMIAVILLYKDNKITEDNKNLIIEGKADVITIIIMTYVMIFMLVLCLVFDEVIGALLFGITIVVQSVLNSILINYFNKNYRK